MTLGYAICGSFCTHARSLAVLDRLKAEGYDILPIVSETAASTDTRFGRADVLLEHLRTVCGHEPIRTIREAEPLGPAHPLDALIIAPCTGNTLAKLANGITDTAVCMAAKAHMRTSRPLLISIASNDALSANLANIAHLLGRKNIFFVPLLQDDPLGKPHSLVADMEQIPDATRAMLDGKQLRPLFLSR